MANKTLYIRENDEKIWEKAEQYVKESKIESLSKFITDLLEKELAKTEVKNIDQNEIVIKIYDRNIGKFRRVKFNGEWLVEDLWLKTNGDSSASVALTAKNNLLYFYQNEDSEECNGYRIYRDFEQMKADPDVNSVLLAEVATKLKEDYVEFLDI